LPINQEQFGPDEGFIKTNLRNAGCVLSPEFGDKTTIKN